MDIESLLDDLRAGSPGSATPETLTAALDAAVRDDDDHTAERAALAAYYASILPEPIIVPALEALLSDPAGETRGQLRGRLWWIKLNRTAALAGDNPIPASELAATILATETEAYPRQRVFAFLKSWHLRSAIFPFLGSRAVSSLEIQGDGREVDQLKEEARLAARHAVDKALSVVQAAIHSVPALAEGALGTDDAEEALRLAEPLLDDFPWGSVDPAAMAAAACGNRGARPPFRALLRVYGAWLWARFGGASGEDAAASDGIGTRDADTRKTGGRLFPLPQSWGIVCPAASGLRAVDPWTDVALLKLEAMLSLSPVLRHPAPEIRSPGDLRAALTDALAAPAPDGYAGPACEQSLTEVIKATVTVLCGNNCPALSPSECEALGGALRSASSYRPEAAATLLRIYGRRGVSLEAVLPVMIDTLLAAPDDMGIYSPGSDVADEVPTQVPGCNTSMAYDNADAPPAGADGGFMNLDNLTMLLGLCMPANTSHRLALAIAEAVDSGTLPPEVQGNARAALEKAAAAGNRVAAGRAGTQA